MKIIKEKIENNIIRTKFNLYNKRLGDDGIGVVEVILILLVLVGLVLIFKTKIIAIAKGIFTNISDQIDKV